MHDDLTPKDKSAENSPQKHSPAKKSKAPSSSTSSTSGESKPIRKRTPRKPKETLPSPLLTNKDISPILQGWEYEPGTLNVRKIIGIDGSHKLQMRIDLGVLQMNMTGRPDGVLPHGCESYLDYHEKRLEIYSKAFGNDTNFYLDTSDCELLREESAMYYQRYLSLFVLGEFSGVVRDTTRNLRVLDLCGKYAQDEHDRLILEQYRPYILMMNTRAKAFIEFKEDRLGDAMETINIGIAEIREFFVRFGQEEAFPKCSEVKVLKRFAREIRGKMPVDPIVKLKKRLNNALAEERYEDAAQYRDRIAELLAKRSEGA